MVVGDLFVITGNVLFKKVIKPTNRECLSFCGVYICWGASGIIIGTYESSYSMGKVIVLFSYILPGDRIHNVVPNEKREKI